MADGVIIPATGSGTATPTVATDDAGVAGHVQIVKLALSADGVATALTADNTNGVLTNPSDRALRDCGKIDVASLDQYTPGQQLSAASLPVVLPSDQTVQVNVTGGGVGVTQATVPWDTQLRSGSTTAVTQATGTNLHMVVDSGTVTTVSTVSAVSSCTLAPETTKVIGTVRNLGNAGAIFDAATGAAVPANVIYNGARAATANPTNATGGNAVGVMADKAGRLVVVNQHVRELVGIQQTTITNSSAETTIVTADATNMLDITNLEITSGTATAFTVTIKDSTAGTTRKIYSLTGAVGAGVVVPFVPPMPQAAANNNWTATLSSNAVTCYINVNFVKNL